MPDLGPHAAPMPAQPLESVRPHSDEELQRTLDDTLARRPHNGPIWVFAYGSLIWDPCFRHSETRRAVLSGYHRAFTMWSVHARGTPEQPGLGLGLGEGGDCTGVAFKLDEKHSEDALWALWQREMYIGIYRPLWLPVDADGRALTALCFVADTAHPQYASGLTVEQTARVIASAHGKFGSCRDYLAETVAALEQYGTPDVDLAALLALVDRL